jgi:predicted transcriptional regulator
VLETASLGLRNVHTSSHTTGVITYGEEASMRKQRVAKVTISLSKDLLELADRLARERATTRSDVIAHLLAKEEGARIQALMAEGYREMAEENRQLTEETFPLARDMLLRETQWDKPTDG